MTTVWKEQSIMISGYNEMMVLLPVSSPSVRRPVKIVDVTARSPQGSRARVGSRRAVHDERSYSPITANYHFRGRRDQKSWKRTRRTKWHKPAPSFRLYADVIAAVSEILAHAGERYRAI
jgi:hypothetical protein